MTSVARYAVYALPGALGSDDAVESVRLRALAESWFARDDLDLQQLTASARRYGFHATLAAPFRLAEGYGEADLKAAATALAETLSPVSITAIAPQAIGSFRALRPTGDETELTELSNHAVRAFGDFRAPLSAVDIERRRPDLMTKRQRELFEQWGYPFVFDEFRFHLTLTDRVPAERSAAIDTAIAAHFAEVIGLDVPVRSIALFVEPAPGEPFEIVSVHPLRGDATAASTTATAAEPTTATEPTAATHPLETIS